MTDFGFSVSKSEFLTLCPLLYAYRIPTTGCCIPWDGELFFRVDFIVEGDLLSKGKLIFRFPASSFANLAS